MITVERTNIKRKQENIKALSSHEGRNGNTVNQEPIKFDGLLSKLILAWNYAAARARPLDVD